MNIKRVFIMQQLLPLMCAVASNRSVSMNAQARLILLQQSLWGHASHDW